MDCYWYKRLGILYQWASSRLLIPKGDNVFPLCIRWASRAFLTASRLLRMSSSGIRVTSFIECPAWLKCKETGVGSLSCWWFKVDRQCSPNSSFSWHLVSKMCWHLHLLHWIKWRRFLDLQDKWSTIFLCLLVVVKMFFFFNLPGEKDGWDSVDGCIYKLWQVVAWEVCCCVAWTVPKTQVTDSIKKRHVDLVPGFKRSVTNAGLGGWTCWQPRFWPKQVPCILDILRREKFYSKPGWTSKTLQSFPSAHKTFNSTRSSPPHRGSAWRLQATNKFRLIACPCMLSILVLSNKGECLEHAS